MIKNCKMTKTMNLKNLTEMSKRTKIYLQMTVHGMRVKINVQPNLLRIMIKRRSSHKKKQISIKKQLPRIDHQKKLNVKLSTVDDDPNP